MGYVNYKPRKTRRFVGNTWIAGKTCVYFHCSFESKDRKMQNISIKVCIMSPPAANHSKWMPLVNDRYIPVINTWWIYCWWQVRKLKLQYDCGGNLKNGDDAHFVWTRWHEIQGEQQWGNIDYVQKVQWRLTGKMEKLIYLKRDCPIIVVFRVLFTSGNYFISVASFGKEWPK